jgi:hypothetical protein
MSLAHSQPATQSLLDDLRSDDGMAWVPGSAWLTQLSIDAAASELTYDLAVDASGQDQPSWRAAGLEIASEGDDDVLDWILGGVAASILGFGVFTGAVARKRS